MATRTDVTKVQAIEIGAEEVARTTPLRRKAPIVAAIFLAALAVGAVLASSGPSAEQLEQAHWRAVVEYYGALYQTMAGADAFEAPSDPQTVGNDARSEGGLESAHWQQVVDYYENQWVLQQR
jgi:hypothetical protein